MDLQTLQSELYADVARFVGSRGGYAFAARYDNILAVTNGLDRTDHDRLQALVRNRYPVTVSLAIGTGATPITAIGTATGLLQTTGSAQSTDRREALVGDSFAESPGPDALTVGHFDIVDATARYTDAVNAFDALARIREGCTALRRYMRTEHESVTFFVGGDNLIAVCPSLTASAFNAAVDHVRETTNIELQVGIGRGETPRKAGLGAKQALEECREHGTRVEGGVPTATGD